MVGVNGEVVAPSEEQEYLGAAVLNSMDVVSVMGRRRRSRVVGIVVEVEANVSEEAILDVVVEQMKLERVGLAAVMEGSLGSAAQRMISVLLMLVVSLNFLMLSRLLKCSKSIK